MKLQLISSYICMTALLGSFGCSTLSQAESRVDDTAITSDKKSEAIQRLLADFHKSGKLNGTVLVSENSKVIYSSAFG